MKVTIFSMTSAWLRSGCACLKLASSEQCDCPVSMMETTRQRWSCREGWWLLRIECSYLQWPESSIAEWQQGLSTGEIVRVLLAGDCRRFFCSDCNWRRYISFLYIYQYNYHNTQISLLSIMINNNKGTLNLNDIRISYSYSIIDICDMISDQSSFSPSCISESSLDSPRDCLFIGYGV